MYLKDKGPHFSVTDMACCNYTSFKSAKFAITNAFQPDDPSFQGDGATGKLVLQGHEYPSIIKKQIAWNYRSTPQEPHRAILKASCVLDDLQTDARK